MKKICLIIPYFGIFPNYFNFWLKSCEYNTSIDWLIITDNNFETSADNIKIVNIEWNSFVEYVQSKYNFKISLRSPYKLCDYKPAYGEIFQKYLYGYDFWGHCDMDVIWGDLRSYITDDLLKNYDRLFRYGHLSLYKNSPHINSLYRQNVESVKYDYKYIFSHPENYIFDEDGITYRSRFKEFIYSFVPLKLLEPIYKTTGGMYTICKELKIRQCLNVYYDDVRQNQKSFTSTRCVANYKLEELKKMPCLFKFAEGHLFRINWDANEIIESETMYAHFQKRKLSVKTNNYNNYYVIPNSFVPTSEGLEKYKEQCSYTLFYGHYIGIRFHNLKRIIKKKFYGKSCINR